jgi:hypothetical protein
MDKGNDKKSIKDQVMEAIKRGQVKMRPRWHFVLRASLFFTGLTIVSMALVYLASFIIFFFQRTGAISVPVFGFRGIISFLFSLPWLLILFGIIFVVLLELLIRRYSFAYRRPLLYSLLGIIVFASLVGFVVSKTSLHRGFFARAQERKLPIAGPLYRHYMGNMGDKTYPRRWDGNNNQRRPMPPMPMMQPPR